MTYSQPMQGTPSTHRRPSIPEVNTVQNVTRTLWIIFRHPYTGALEVSTVVSEVSSGARGVSPSPSGRAFEGAPSSAAKERVDNRLHFDRRGGCALRVITSGSITSQLLVQSIPYFTTASHSTVNKCKYKKKKRNKGDE